MNKVLVLRSRTAVLAAIALAIPSFFLVATADAATNWENRPKSILWVQPMKDHPVHRLMQAGFLTECKKLKLKCTIVGHASATVWDVPATIPLVDAAIASGHYGGVAVYPFDPALASLSSKLSKKGYPIIGWHSVPKAGTYKGMLGAAAQFVPNAGIQPAKAICTQAGGTGTVAITEGSLNDEENLKAASFKKELATSCPGMKVTDIGIEGFDSVKAIAIAVGMLSANPEIVAAYSTTGNGAQTWSKAAEQTSRKITIIGMDYIRQNLDLIRDGKVYGVVAQPLYEEGALVADLFNNLFSGKTIKYANYLPSDIVTKANVNHYYAIVKAAGQ